jgi:hypothetical protein
MMEEEFSVDATVQLIETLLKELGQTDPHSRGRVEELVRSLMQLYGAGLGRVISILREAGTEAMISRLAEDKLVASLLLLHALHPVDAGTRVRKALHRLERGLESHHLELVGIEDGVARVAVVRDGGGSPPPSLAASIERAVAESAPDLAGVEVEGLAAVSLVQIAPAAI